MNIHVHHRIYTNSRIGLLSVWALQQQKRRGKPSPPGPRGVPILGILPFLGDAAHLAFSRWAEEFGPVFQVFMGSRRTVVVSGVKAARQVSEQQVHVMRCGICPFVGFIQSKCLSAGSAV